MSKIGTTVNVPVSSHSEAHDQLMSAINAMKAKVVSNSQSTLVLKRGSQAKMRLLGGMFISAADLPVLATVEFDPKSPKEINITVIEKLGVGFIAGMGDKFQIACTEFAILIANAVKKGEM
jgi:hypothetical protein